MARHERSRQPVAAQPLSGPLRIKARRDANGRVQIVGPKPPVTPVVEAAERPPQPDDPRPAPFRNVPPFGGAA
jgi:hypothetical protein